MSRVASATVVAVPVSDHGRLRDGRWTSARQFRAIQAAALRPGAEVAAQILPRLRTSAAASTTRWSGQVLIGRCAASLSSAGRSDRTIRRSSSMSTLGDPPVKVTCRAPAAISCLASFWYWRCSAPRKAPEQRGPRTPRRPARSGPAPDRTRGLTGCDPCHPSEPRRSVRQMR